MLPIAKQRLIFYVTDLPSVIVGTGKWIGSIVLLGSAIEYSALFIGFMDELDLTLFDRLKVFLFFWVFAGSIFVVASILAKHWFLEEYCKKNGLTMSQLDTRSSDEFREIWERSL